VTSYRQEIIGGTLLARPVGTIPSHGFAG